MYPRAVCTGWGQLDSRGTPGTRLGDVRVNARTRQRVAKPVLSMVRDCILAHTDWQEGVTLVRDRCQVEHLRTSQSPRLWAKRSEHAPL